MAIRYFNTSIRNLAYRLRKFDDILGRELVNEIMSHEDEIIDCIIQNQLYDRGVNGNDVEIMSYEPYRPRTVKKKIKKGQPYNRVTLKDTGEWYASLKLVYDSDGFFITSTDEKNKYLKQKYGANILRLTNQNLSMILNTYIRPSLAKKLKKYLQNGQSN